MTSHDTASSADRGETPRPPTPPQARAIPGWPGKTAALSPIFPPGVYATLSYPPNLRVKRGAAKRKKEIYKKTNVNSEHDIGKVTRDYVPLKCNRGEFGHHARRQASIYHSHRIHTPTRLQDTRKPAARVSPNRPPPITPNRTPPPAQKCAVTARTFIRGRSP